MKNINLSPEETQELLSVFQRRRSAIELFIKSEGLNSKCCPCCGYPALTERNAYEICIICDWEDDGQDDKNADQMLGGPNGELSLTEARINFEMNFRKFESSTGYKRIENPVEIMRIIEQQKNGLETLIAADNFEKIVEAYSQDNATKDIALYAILSYLPSK